MQTKTLIVLFLLLYSKLFSQSWIEFPTISQSDNKSCYFFNDNEGIIVGFYKPFIQNTVNAGVNWNILVDTLYGDHYEVFFRDQYTGYIYGYSGLFRSTNSGISWSRHSMGITLFGYCFVDQNTGFIGGDGDYFITTNSGSNWHRKYGFHTDTNYLGFSYFDNTLYLLKNFGNRNNQFLKSSNLGGNWELIHSFESGSSSYILSSKYNILYVTAQNYNDTGMILRSVNGGLNWTKTSTSGKAILRDMMFHKQNGNFGYIVGNYANDHNNAYKGIILKTTNSGDTWIEQVYGNSNTQFNSVFITDRFVFIAATGVVVRGEHTIGINSISNLIPKKLVLHQNYPNPFNPKTKIKFEIPQNLINENLKLIVYDVLGSEIKVIADQKFSPGVYEADFDAANLPSGIYFYKLSNSSFTEVKKMIILK